MAARDLLPIAVFAAGCLLGFAAVRGLPTRPGAIPEESSRAAASSAPSADSDPTAVREERGAFPQQASPKETQAGGVPESRPPTKAKEPIRSEREATFAALGVARGRARDCLEGGIREPLEFRLRTSFTAQPGRLRQRGGAALYEVRYGGDAVTAATRSCLESAFTSAFDLDGDIAVESGEYEIDEDVVFQPRGSLRLRWSDCGLVGASTLKVALLIPAARDPFEVRTVPCSDGFVQWDDLFAMYWMIAVLADGPSSSGALLQAEVVAEETVSPVAILEPIAATRLTWETSSPHCSGSRATMRLTDVYSREHQLVARCDAGSIALPVPDLGRWEVAASLRNEEGALVSTAAARFVRTPAPMDVPLAFAP